MYRSTGVPIHTMQTLRVVIGSAGFTLFCLLAFVQAVSAQSAVHSVSDAFTAISCNYEETLVLAEYQGWHGLPSHQQPPPYHSQDRAIIAAAGSVGRATRRDRIAASGPGASVAASGASSGPSMPAIAAALRVASISSSMSNARSRSTYGQAFRR